MSGVAVTTLNNPKTVRAWYMYDWANSVYSLVITTAIFPIYYNGIAVENGSNMIHFWGFTIQNSVLYTYALSLSFLIVSAILPLLSGAADYTGKKKSFMKFFVWLGSLSCMGLFFFKDINTLEWALTCSILASVGYSASLVFYDAFLPEIVTEDKYDITSAKGYSMGYYGSVVLMLICTVMILNHEMFGFEAGNKGEIMATRVSFLFVGLWWIGFSTIPFIHLPDNPYNRKPVGNMFTNGYKEIRKVWTSLRQLPNLKKFLWAFFFYNSGVQTVMYLATLFGKDVLHLESGNLIAVIVIIQLVGSIGAWAFAKVSTRKGNRFSLLVMITVWIAVCIAAYLIQTAFQFYILAFIVGLIMGGIQALSRATYSKLIPGDTPDHASYFSFYDVTYNFSIVIGTFSYGLIHQLTGDMRYSALALAFFFIFGMMVLLTLKAKSISHPIVNSRI